ncbi:TonB-dependent receptor [Novosphingobium sp. KCTC 2891]|uniref:TonB-dependent receptor n=1 Tax=Novosphingobium sp. KCTC 2891 TaxID=2989730 RepID=UPI002221F640|nr:TonB-dependent receptor [Novosphingobium sp. KCTC 2891]MCW1382779.1 TonB-dependent receptor [Novosphingobium sp. KCTC 2891]
MKGALKGLLLASCMLGGGHVSFAQEAQPQATAETENTGLTEITVTARKRVESAQSVPVAVTAISAKTIEQRDMTSIEKIAAATPSLTVGHASNGSSAQVTLRGIGSSSTSIGIEQSVATVVDGVYYGQGRVLEEGFFDLAGVEVLKGPQVLFFGKNATAGVISIKTADPTADWEFRTKASYEFKGQQAQVEGIASGPLSPTLGVRVALRGTKAWGGYYDNVSRDYQLANLPFVSHPTTSDQPGNREFLGRVTLKWEPTSQITDTLKASFDYNKANNSSYNYVNYFCPTGKTSLAGYECGFNFVTHQNNMPAEEAKNFPYAQDGKLYNRYKSAAVTNTFNYDMGDVTLTNVTNFNWNNNQWLCACEFGSSPNSVWATENSSWKAFSNEVRALTHYDSPVNLMVGVLYQKTRRDFAQYVSYSASNVPSAGPNQYQDGTKTSFTKGETISAFGQVTWKFLPGLEFDAGVRYTHEKKDSEFTQPYVSAAFAGVWPQGVVYSAHQRFDNWSPDFSLTYKPMRDVMFYASYKTGYKSGGFSNGGIASVLGDPSKDLVFNPETTAGWEGGVKSTLLDNQLRLNLGLYSYKYKDLQIDFFDSSRIAFQTLTADARTKGVEAEFEFAPRAVAGLNVHGNVNYNKAVYTNFPLAPCYAGQTIAEGCNTQFSAIAGGFTRQNLNGATLGMAPHWTGAFGLTYDTPVASGLKAGISADVRYSSSYLVSGFGESFSRNPSYAVLDAGVRLGAEDDNWQVALVGKNLTNKQYINGGVDGPLTGGGTGTASGTHADLLGFGTQPRTVQFQVSKRF